MVSVCWKTVNVYLLFYPMPVPSLSLISSNLPRLNCHWYFCTKDHFDLGCWWKSKKLLCVREQPKQKNNFLQTKRVQAWMKRVNGHARGRGKPVVLPSKKIFPGTFFPIGSLVLHFASVLPECSLSVTIKESLFIETDHWICFSDRIYLREWEAQEA